MSTVFSFPGQVKIPSCGSCCCPKVDALDLNTDEPIEWDTGCAIDLAGTSSAKYVSGGGDFSFVLDKQMDGSYYGTTDGPTVQTWENITDCTTCCSCCGSDGAIGGSQLQATVTCANGILHVVINLLAETCGGTLYKIFEGSGRLGSSIGNDIPGGSGTIGFGGSVIITP